MNRALWILKGWIPQSLWWAWHDSEQIRQIEQYLNSLRQEHYQLTLEARRASSAGNSIRESQISEKLEHIEKMAWRMRSLRESFSTPWDELRDGSSSMPPRLGERLLLLILTKEDRINIPGDLAEEFEQIAVMHGNRFAQVWYYKQVAASAWPMIRKGIRWGLFAWVAEWVRRLI